MPTTDEGTGEVAGHHEDGPAEGILAEARRALEAVVMVAESPADPQLLAQLVELSPERVEGLLEELAAQYEAEHRGFRLVKAGGGWRFVSHEDCAPWVERYVLSGQSARLSAAALETLAIVAYKQPISRAQVAAIRGVSVDGVVRTLEQRGYIAEVARDPGPGNAILFGTTPLFLEKLGLDSVADLPPIAQFVPDAGVVEQLEHGLRAEPLPAEPGAREVPDVDGDVDGVGEDVAEADGEPGAPEGGPWAPERGAPEVDGEGEPEAIPEGDGGVVPAADGVVDGEPAGEAEGAVGSGRGAAEDGGEPGVGDGDAATEDEADPGQDPGAEDGGSAAPEAAERSDGESAAESTGAEPSGDGPDAASS